MNSKNPTTHETSLANFRDFPLDPFQEEAIRAIQNNESVIVAAPTGAGKTVIAEYAIDQALKQGRRIIYTSPIKALSNQKYRDFSQQYPGDVGITTGDVSIRPDASALIMTTEIFRNTIFESPERLRDVSYVIFDEVHYMDDRERGTVWEESLIFAPTDIRVLALSATVSNLKEMHEWLATIRPADWRIIVEKTRPVPLEIFVADVENGVSKHQDTGFKRLKSREKQRRRQRIESIPRRFQRAHRRIIEHVREQSELPCLFFFFSRAACERLAEKCIDLDFYDHESDRQNALKTFDHYLELYQLDPLDHRARTLRRLLQQGISFHHAGLLPVLKEIVERLFSDGHIRMIFTTETFALGVNMPARAVAFEGIRKFNGTTRVPLECRQFMQMAGRAGRRGLDDAGSVYVTFDPVLDDADTAERIITGRVEPVRSQFNLSYATLLNLYRHLGDRIFEACERSFANFYQPTPPPSKRRVKGRRGRGKHKHSKKHSKSQKAKPNRGFENMLNQVQRKLNLLTEMEYINPDADSIVNRLTPKGLFACQIYGRELQATELLYQGLLDHLSPEKISVLFTALIWESRPDSGPSHVDPRRLVGKTFQKANRLINDLALLESEYGIRTQQVTLDWNLSGVVYTWAKGEDFDNVRAVTNASDGDIVRTLRQTLQLMRMVAIPLLRQDNPVLVQHAKIGRRLNVAMDLLKRDLVDAEWQLKVEEEAEDEERDYDSSHDFDHDDSRHDDSRHDDDDDKESWRSELPAYGRSN